MKDKIRNKVIEILYNSNNDWAISKDVVINNADTFANTLGFDSLDEVEFIMHLEINFNIVLTDDTLQNYHTVGELVEFLAINKYIVENFKTNE